MTLRGAAVKGGLLALALRAGDAFRPPSRAAPVRGSPRGLAADPATEAEKLRAQAAKYRAEYEQLSQEMGKAAPPSSDAPAGAAAAPAAREDLLSANMHGHARGRLGRDWDEIGTRYACLPSR